MQCECPAHFHEPVNKAENNVFPDKLAETFRSFNLGPKDINFNSLLATFQVIKEEKYQLNMNQILNLLKDEGIEVLALDKRELDAGETVYLRGKALNNEQIALLSKAGNLGKETIRGTARPGSDFYDKYGRFDPSRMAMDMTRKETHNDHLSMTLEA